MDLSTLNTDVPIPVLAIVFWVIGALLVTLVASAPYLSKRMKWSDTTLPAAIQTVAGIVAALSISLGMISVGAADERNLNDAFHQTLSSDYDLTTDLDLKEILSAAESGYIIKMSDESEALDVRPHLDGEKLTFTKVTKEEPINPRT